mgnify:CR=1 FL=1
MTTSYIKWCCRRGVLELDVLLERFIDEHYEQLTIEQKNIFHQFIQCEDSWLQSWLLYHDQPVPDAFVFLIKLMLDQA